MSGNLETIYQCESTTVGEIEATGLQTLLEANGIECLVVGDSVLPNLGFEVRVPAEQVEEARRIIEEALANGPAAAEAAESAGEEPA